MILHRAIYFSFYSTTFNFFFHFHLNYESADFRPDKANLRPERADFRPLPKKESSRERAFIKRKDNGTIKVEGKTIGH